MLLSGNLVTGDAVISCPHGGRAAPPATAGPGPHLDGRALPSAGADFPVTGCPHNRPCAYVRWTPDENGPRFDGVPVLLETTPGVCVTAAGVPQGAPVFSGAGRPSGQGAVMWR
jgi:hypothetical protein